MTPKECRRIGEEKRGMYPWTLKEILRQFKHPNMATLDIMVNRWGERARAEIGLRPHGTVYYAPHTSVKRLEGSIPQHYIPYTSLATAKRDEETGTWKGGELMRGWRPLLHDLCKAGIIISCQEVSWLIKRNSREVQPRDHHCPPRRWRDPTGTKLSIYP